MRPLGADVVRLRLRHPVPLRIGDRAVLRDPGRRRVAAGVTVLDVAPAAAAPPGCGRPAGGRAGRACTARTRPASCAAAASRGGPTSSRWACPRAEVDALRAPGAGGRLLDPVLATALGAGWRPRWPPTTPRTRSTPACRSRPRGGRSTCRTRGWSRSSSGTPEVGRSAGPDRRAHAARRPRRRARRHRAAPGGARGPARSCAADLQQHPFDAPEAARLAALGLGPRQLASLVRNGELLRLADGVVLLPGADDRAVEVLATLGPEFTLSAARQALGTSRRVAVPLLELLARTGRTERTADGGHRLTRP